MDALVHVFVLDVSIVLRDIFSYANRLIVLNIAYYKATALLSNGENAHVTVRNPMWWKRMLDSISIDFPAVNILLLCSPTYRSTEIFEIWKAGNEQPVLVLRPNCQRQLIQESYQSPTMKFRLQRFNCSL